MSHVLLVEDDPAVLQLLQAMTEFGGFTSSQAVSAAEALRRVETQSFDAILLDLGLPDLGGSQLIEKIRAVSDVPVLVVSDESDNPTVVAALHAGADDFVTKPFMPGKLLARIRVAMRRHAAAHGEPVNGAPSASESSRSFSTHRAIKPGSMADRLITFLRSRERELVSSDEIISAIWSKDKQRNLRNLRVLVMMVRRKLKAQGQPFEIITVHGRGYRLVAPDLKRQSGLRRRGTSESKE